jgi:hypothetical protein
MEENKESLSNLRANLSEYGLSLDQIPWVIQHNKRDLPNVYTLDELNAELNPGGKIPFFEAVAKDGKGVFETFRGISHLLMEKVTRDLRRTSGGPPQRPAPQEAAAASAAVPAHAVPHNVQESPAFANAAVDYGREIELPGDAASRPHLTPVNEAPVAASRPEPVAAAPAPPRPVQPAPVASAPSPVAPPRQPAPAPTRAAAPAPAPAPRVEHAASPAAGAHAMAHGPHASSPSAPGLAPRMESEELIVPIKLGVAGTHEIVLRIVLKLEG